MVLLSMMITMLLVTMLTYDPGGGMFLIPNRSGWVKNVKTRIILEPDECVSRDVAVIIHSHASDFILRSSQRDAMKLQETLKPIFVVFHSKDVQTIELEDEAKSYNDLLFGDMEESYPNLIYKHVMALRWVKDKCADNMVIKMDDDIYVNFPSLLDIVKRNIPKNNPNWMMGLLQLGLPVLRTEDSSKWSVGPQDWSEDFYPDFLSGWCYISSSSAVRNIVNQLEIEDSVFWIDDVMITGVVAEKRGVERISLNSYFTVHKKIMDCCSETKKDEQCDYLVGPTDNNVTLLDSLVNKQTFCHKSKQCNIATNCDSAALFAMSTDVIGEVMPI